MGTAFPAVDVGQGARAPGGTTMTLIDWKSGYELGVPAMDAEHKELIAAMNRVHELAGQGAAKAVVEAALQRLVALTKQHFADEEAHMAKIQYADRVRHGLIHQDMLRRVGGYCDQFRAGDGKVAREFFDFLVYWLGAHITGIDRKYAPARPAAPAPQPVAPQPLRG
jgi:hemerythrin